MKPPSHTIMERFQRIVNASGPVWQKDGDKAFECSPYNMAYGGRVARRTKTDTVWRAFIRLGRGWSLIDGKNEFDSPEDAQVAVEATIRKLLQKELDYWS